jgi:hypothetical protein
VHSAYRQANKHINQATMLEAMQEYLGKRYTPKLKVTAVKSTGQGGTFDVDVAEPEPEPLEQRRGAEEMTGWVIFFSASIVAALFIFWVALHTN